MINTFEMNGLSISLTEDELYEAVTVIGEHADEQIYSDFCSRIIKSSCVIKK